MAENCFMVVRLLLIITVTNVDHFVASQSYDPMCGVSGSSSSTSATTNGVFHFDHACNTQALPWDASQVQGYVLKNLKTSFHNTFSRTNQPRHCDGGGYYRGDDGHHIELFSYASCSESSDRQLCYDCLKGADGMVRDHCNGSSGVRIWSETCCARYERFSFCVPTP